MVITNIARLISVIVTVALVRVRIRVRRSGLAFVVLIFIVLIFAIRLIFKTFNITVIGLVTAVGIFVAWRVGYHKVVVHILPFEF